MCLADGEIGEKWVSEIKSLYRWESWKSSESEFAGIRVRQQQDFSIPVDLKVYTNKFITEPPLTRERTRQRQESLTAQEISVLRGVLGTASWRAQQMSPQFAVDVSLLLSVMQDLLDANKFVRDMRRSAAQSLHFHSFNETPWHQLVFASWADASDRHRPDGSQTGGYVITLATEKLFGHGQEDEASVMAWRSFKLWREISGSNNGETQALAFADESLWLAQLAWSEMHGVPMRRWHLDEAVRQVGGMLEVRVLISLVAREEEPIGNTIPMPTIARRSSNISSLFPVDLPQNFMVAQQRQQISELQFHEFPTPSSFTDWKIKFKNQLHNNYAKSQLHVLTNINSKKKIK